MNLIRQGACGKGWTGSNVGHCSKCHLEYLGIKAFDQHQTISRGVVTCHPPETRGLVARPQPWGVLWALPVDDAARKRHAALRHRDSEALTGPGRVEPPPPKILSDLPVHHQPEE